ncbi:MAG: hypothetical protein IT236_06015 [Bacteroidia bacterium]|nr:hypothetical protein [Bacteroidia bacterium]
MANFRIDKLELTLTGTPEIFNLTGWCNTDAADTAGDVTGTINASGLEIDFIGATNIADKKFKFSANGLNYINMIEETPDLISLFFSDSAHARVKKGGILIKDTKYPPPTEKKFKTLDVLYKHEGFTKQFSIVKVSCVRNIATKKFTILMDVYYSSKYADYTHEQSIPFLDTVRPNKLTNKISVNQLFKGSQGTGTIQCENVAILLSDSKGIPFVIIDKNVTWNEEIDYKKANIYIAD